MENNMREKMVDAVLGLAIGDAVGVPVEFEERGDLKKNPVTNMREYGSHNMPRGTWSDDTSMTLALMDAVTMNSGEIDYCSIMNNFLAWTDKAKYTATDEIFDIGMCVRNALQNFEYGCEPIGCGPDGEYDCGNGALMRIIPMLFWCVSKYGFDFTANAYARDIMGNVHI